MAMPIRHQMFFKPTSLPPHFSCRTAAPEFMWHQGYIEQHMGAAPHSLAADLVRMRRAKTNKKKVQVVLYIV